MQFTSPSAEAPNKQPQLAASPKLVALAHGARNSIFVATSADEGRTFSKPSKVAEVGGLMLGRHRGPRVAILGDTIVVSAVGRTAGDLLAWRSTDGGRTWSASVRVNDVLAAAREGLHAMTSDGHGKLFAAWLDLRTKGTRLYGALSKDSGATWSANTLIYESPDGTICQCCHPSATMDASARIWVMFRNCLGGARDMYLASSMDGATFSKPAKLGAGPWNINACPLDGGGVALDHGRPVTAWRREKELYLDVPGEPEQPIGEGADIAIAGVRRASMPHGRAAARFWRAGRRIRSPRRSPRTARFPRCWHYRAARFWLAGKTLGRLSCSRWSKCRVGFSLRGTSVPPADSSTEFHQRD